MNRQILHQQLHHRLENLIERHLELMQQQPSISQQEMSDLLREIRISYELALSLHHHNALKSMEELELLVAHRYTGKETAPEPEQKISKPVQPVAENMEELTVDAINLVEERKRTLVPPAEPSSTPDLNHRYEAPTTIAGSFRETKTLAETISGRSRLAEAIQHQPIRDLRTAIGINERFLFTQFLFGNDAEQFSRTVDHLNHCDSWATAKQHLENEVAPRYGWNDAQGTVRQFVELVERRFGV
jgi:hypothetical protein